MDERSGWKCHLVRRAQKDGATAVEETAEFVSPLALLRLAAAWGRSAVPGIRVGACILVRIEGTCQCEIA